MRIADIGGLRLHYRDEGDRDGAPVVFANSLGTDLRLWDDMLPHLPAGLRLIRYDKRGHGLSECPRAPYSMGQLVGDLEKLLDHLEVRNAVIVGLSIGGMIAQGLATKRLDQVRAAVLSNTGAKIGTREMWEDRIGKVEDEGIEALADGILERWFSGEFRETDDFQAWRNMLLRQPVQGYVGCCHAIAGTDFFATTAALRLPVLGIAGSVDGSTPPDLVRETAELVPGAEFRLIRGAGHLPCVEKPEEYAEILTDFLTAIGHV
ncbi:3-oxoadipate enol-lactonase [Roseivivax halodurans JCM 10272]|uniref:3-oxoadipate enol-lactonase n=1 Tax=Roseivivax halodurans JCM 10272 TaxID=1449350 RepID=X7EM10_9RHOB|nr:3-oxoadipate enol-lactonase [Roseivivax halodurans]ETX16203.1 3-oxoadipate enol-lactonase [Roseivivax halodurans JCM 10272]